MPLEDRFLPNHNLEYLAEKSYRLPLVTTVVGGIGGSIISTAALGLAELVSAIYSCCDHTVLPNPTYGTTAFFALAGAATGACAFAVTLAEEIYYPRFENFMTRKT